MEHKPIDNINYRLVDALREQITPGACLAIQAESFSIYAYQELREQLDACGELRFIFTEPTFDLEGDEEPQRREYYIPKRGRERTLYGSEFEIRLANQLGQKALSRGCAEWIRTHARFKSNRSGKRMVGYIHVGGAEPALYSPIIEFSQVQLGTEPGDIDSDIIQPLYGEASLLKLNHFNQRWAQGDFEDVTDRVLARMSSAYKENAPEYVYFLSLLHIFSERQDDISEDYAPREPLGFRNSAIWGMLYDFQEQAALAIIHKLERYNGCILADSVGLGKTFTALAVIKYYEMRNRIVLVLCPKRLSENWNTYRNNYKNNLLGSDRLRYDVVYHTDLLRGDGMSNGKDLAQLNWESYDLIVIDESHNFRNGGSDAPGRVNRYDRLMAIIEKGAKTKVLMLSATPVNNRFFDLNQQLKLAYGRDKKAAREYSERLGLQHDIDQVFRNAQQAYAKWAKLGEKECSTQRLVESLPADFFRVLDAVTIARSREHIKRYYDSEQLGRFPERAAPITRRPALTDLPGGVSFTEIAERIHRLRLAIYMPSNYMHESAKEKYGIGEGGGLTVGGRESGIRTLMFINLLKRVESSISAFRATVLRILGHYQETLAHIQEHRADAPTLLKLDDLAQDFEQEAEDIDRYWALRKWELDLADMDLTSWQRELEDDRRVLQGIVDMIAPIDAAHDLKLQSLQRDILEKVQHPFNEGNRKVLVFSAFSDTAGYLYEELSPLLLSHGLHSALITGNKKEKATLKTVRGNFNDILTFFSPRSKHRDSIHPDATDEIDVLFATDCISEGQNLQDCDYVVNYDIHWNPVRIIQRFGRIDRIGSTNRTIQMVNYWPDMELDAYIHLKARVENRMKAAVMSSTGDDDLLSAKEKGDLEYRRAQLKRLEKEVVDLEDMEDGISIIDFGLEDFSQDLNAYRRQHPELDNAPIGLNAVVQGDAEAEPGVIFVLRNRHEDMRAGSRNRFYPFYLIYMRMDGSVRHDHLHPKEILDTMRHLCKGQGDYNRELCQAVSRETKDGTNMERYSRLLHAAIAHIVQRKEEDDTKSLFQAGGETSALHGRVRGLDDFTLVSFLIVR